ncbi:hypothetical protein GE118_00805 [Mycoplasma sp. NEAQ87857]|uniref:dUTP diphosphatase n=1 Tax=Mycoplasma sp. NEAQ87857 TaxID=2683967 RepID=UPI0013181AB8|nr:dUTP diphosphatase [Mycoplasma sp. NEAQ87857]QGZ97341.1 hypothetical protein GE118_00805 [Mycoplasma sp. NEAQ87857]
MNLAEIFEMQRKLDITIAEKRKKINPSLSEKDLEVQKQLALIVEAAEFVNEVQSFKYWKENKNISNSKIKEEFVDLLHFLVNFSNSYGVSSEITPKIVFTDINQQLRELFISIVNMMKNINKETITNVFEIALGTFKILGFSYTELFNAYYAKNQENYNRANNNY